MKKFSYSKAYSEFNCYIEKERAFFLENGMSAEHTEMLIEYTKQQFRDDCAYNDHNISLYNYTAGMEEEGKSPFIVMAWDTGLKRHRNNNDDGYIYLNWIETIKNEKLKEYFSSLSIEDKIILIEIFFNNKTQVELAEKLGISRQTVAKRYNRIFKEMKIAMCDD